MKNHSLLCSSGLAYSARGRVEGYSLALASRSLHAEAVVYTSSLGNHSQIVADLTQGRPLHGNERDVLRQVRDWRLRTFAEEVRTAIAETLLLGEEQGTQPAAYWLRKPVESGGGCGIYVWNSEALDGDHNLQGTSMACLGCLRC